MKHRLLNSVLLKRYRSFFTRLKVYEILKRNTGDGLGPRKIINIRRLRRIFAQIQGAASGAYLNMQHVP